MPARPASARARPLAWPTDIAVRVFTWNSTRSTASAIGRYSSMSASSSWSSVAKRGGSSSVGGVRITPYAIARWRAPSRHTTPYPQRETPGSMPSTTSLPAGSNTSSILEGSVGVAADAAAALAALEDGTDGPHHDQARDDRHQPLPHRPPGRVHEVDRLGLLGLDLARARVGLPRRGEPGVDRASRAGGR